MSEASERLRAWSHTGDGENIDEVARDIEWLDTETKKAGE